MNNAIKMLYFNFLLSFDPLIGNLGFVNKMILFLIKDPESGLLFDYIMNTYGKKAKSNQKVSISRIS